MKALKQNKIQLEEALKEVEILKGDVDRRIIYAHTRFAEPMLDYIIQTLSKAEFVLVTIQLAVW